MTARGRLIDLQGQPAVGVKVHLASIAKKRSVDLRDTVGMMRAAFLDSFEHTAARADRSDERIVPATCFHARVGCGR